MGTLAGVMRTVGEGDARTPDGTMIVAESITNIEIAKSHLTFNVRVDAREMETFCLSSRIALFGMRHFL